MKLAGLIFCCAHALVADAVSVKLWPNGAPGSEALREKKEVLVPGKTARESTKLSSIHDPSLLVYLPAAEKATGAAMIIAPGGGHRFLSIDTEGTNVAEWLNSVGVAAFVLKYRLAKEEGSPYKVEVEALADARRAIRMVRARAGEWKVNPAKVGMMGFSAGGELTALASTRFDAGKAGEGDAVERQSSRPDYQILIYPGGPSQNVTVTKETPPTFMLCADDDLGPANAILVLHAALKKVGVPVESHIYKSGGHGFGLRLHPEKPNPIYSTWYLRLRDWMSDAGMSVERP